MIRVPLFAIVLAALLLGVQLFQQLALAPADPFTPGQEKRLGRLVNQFNPHLIDEKIRHVVEAGPFDILIFGNSSILSVGQAQIAKFGHIFNVAIPGSSLGSSASLAQILGERGALAPTLLLMVENFEGFTQQVPMMPLRYRWIDNATVLWNSLHDPGVSKHEWLRMAMRLAKEEGILFASFYNESVLAEYVKFYFAGLLPAYSAQEIPLWATYSADGAAGPMTAAKPGHIPVPSMPEQLYVLPGFLAYDLHRLATLPGRPRVIVYESPLEPTSAAHYAALARPGPAALKRVFMDTCARDGLECHLAPILGVPGEASLWLDHYHPPAAVITPFVESLLTQKKKNAFQ